MTALVPAHVGTERPVLFCLPFAGGSELAFRSLAAMASSFDVVAACPAGRGAAIVEPLVDTVTGMAAQFLEVARPQRFARFAILGHSLGGLVAYEAARMLAASQTRPPEFVAVSATPSPITPPLQPLHELGDDALVTHLIEVDDAPASLAHPEIRELFLPILRNDLAAGHDFHGPDHPKLPCPIHAFWGTEDRRVPRSKVEAWSELTEHGFCCTEIPGGHLFVESAPPALVGALEAAFDHSSTS